MQLASKAPGNPFGRACRTRGRLLILAVAALAAASCLHLRRPMFTGPERPSLGPDGRPLVFSAPVDSFPERSLLLPRQESPIRTLDRVDEIFREISTIPGPEPDWRLVPVVTEIDSIQAALDRLELGTHALLRQNWGHSTPEDRERFRRVAALYLRWGLALMRTGEVNQRVWGADKLRTAVKFAPDVPIPTLVLGGYLQLARFRANELDLLHTFTRKNGHTDVIDLREIRWWEREWKVNREPHDLERALALCSRLAERKQGWENGPAWLDLERARLLYLADSTDAARRSAELALATAGAPPPRSPGSGADPGPWSGPDSVTAAQAELLLGVLDVRRLEYESADRHFSRATELAVNTPELRVLASWLSLPWDLWTDGERSQFLATGQRVRWIDAWWRAHDPILATPSLYEDRIEYLRRVGEAWFALSGVTPGMPGPMTDAGRVVLRFGWPAEWTSIGGQPEAGFPESTPINRTWRLLYRFHDGSTLRSAPVILQDHGSGTRFFAVDSLKGPAWPPYVFNYDFGGKAYRYETALARFRAPNGRINLVLAYETFLPEYSVRHPMQGLRFEGSAEVVSTLYTDSSNVWVAGDPRAIPLNRETTIRREWTFRRRTGSVTLPDLEPGVIKIASELTLRNSAGRIVALASDNGADGQLLGADRTRLDASDLLLLESMGDTLPTESERRPVPGVTIYGADPAASPFHPRASRVFLPGERLTFYFEVYNLGDLHGMADAELTMTLQRLDASGDVQYSISLRGEGQTMRRYRINQWNICRSIDLGQLTEGQYRMQMKVHDRQRDEDVERETEFRVIGTDELVRLYNWNELEPGP